MTVPFQPIIPNFDNPGLTIRETSIPLEGGGDTHIHPHGDKSGFTVTTRLMGDVTDHITFDMQGNRIG